MNGPARENNGVAPQELSHYRELAIQYASAFGVKVIAAILFWVIGPAVRLVRHTLEKRQVDPTVLRYLGSVVTGTLNVLLGVGILGYFGIQTTSIAALIAAAGVAIGLAWPGSSPTSLPVPSWSCCVRSRWATS